MKIKTITCHDVYNLGASLQAFALQHYLQGRGHDVEIIDYKPFYLSGHHKLWIIANSRYDKPFIKQLYLLAKLPERLLSLKRKKVFDQFTRDYLKLTRRYNSYEELNSDPPQADCYIAGSDQIWNTLFLNGRDPAFYLDFGSKNIKRISYAASFATKSIVPQYKDFVTEKLRSIDAVSIREKISLPLLKELGRTDGVSVCDPVFLLSKVDWENMINNVEKKAKTDDNYLLVYLTDKCQRIETIASEIKKKTGLKIYTVGPIKSKSADKSFKNAGPIDFLQLIKDSQFVISNSFHATAFSIIMGVRFCVVNRSEGINERMKSILEEFGLSNRLVSEYDDILLEDLNWNEVSHCSDNIVAASKEWLNLQLEK